MEQKVFESIVVQFRNIGEALKNLDLDAVHEHIEHLEYHKHADLTAEKIMCRALIKAKRGYAQLPPEKTEEPEPVPEEAERREPETELEDRVIEDIEKLAEAG